MNPVPDSIQARIDTLATRHVTFNQHLTLSYMLRLMQCAHLRGDNPATRELKEMIKDARYYCSLSHVRSRPSFTIPNRSKPKIIVTRQKTMEQQKTRDISPHLLAAPEVSQKRPPSRQHDSSPGKPLQTSTRREQTIDRSGTPQRSALVRQEQDSDRSGSDFFSPHSPAQRPESIHDGHISSLVDVNTPIRSQDVQYVPSNRLFDDDSFELIAPSQARDFDDILYGEEIQPVPQAQRKQKISKQVAVEDLSTFPRKTLDQLLDKLPKRTVKPPQSRPVSTKRPTGISPRRVPNQSLDGSYHLKQLFRQDPKNMSLDESLQLSKLYREQGLNSSAQLGPSNRLPVSGVHLLTSTPNRPPSQKPEINIQINLTPGNEQTSRSISWDNDDPKSNENFQQVLELMEFIDRQSQSNISSIHVSSRNIQNITPGKYELFKVVNKTK